MDEDSSGGRVREDVETSLEAAAEAFSSQSREKSWDEADRVK